jgi:hypothetical protein
MVDPRMPIDRLAMAGINKALREDPSLKPVSFIQAYLNSGFDLQTIARFIITPERLATRDKVENSVAQSLNRFVSTIIPGLDNPLWYDKEQAQKICDLRESLSYKPRYSEFNQQYENPFSTHMSLRQLRRETGVSSKNIVDDLVNGFALGSLWMEGVISTPNHIPVKQAIHDSVHRSGGGGVTLWEDSIPKNIIRIANDRRMISIVPRVLG